MIGQPIIGSHAIGQSLVTNPQHISKNLFLFITTSLSEKGKWGGDGSPEAFRI